MKRIYIKGLNVCPIRRPNLLHYKIFLETNGYTIVDNFKDSDTIIVWTCGFREDSIRNSISELNKYYRDYPDKEIIIMGCLPDIDRDRLEREVGGFIVPWRNEEEFFESYFKSDIISFKEAHPTFCEEPLCKDAAVYRQQNPDKDATFADQFVKLSLGEGCPYKCTYCTERLAFPPFKSEPLDNLLKAYTHLYNFNSSLRKLFFFSDCTGMYGSDLGYSLTDLVESFYTAYPKSTLGFQNFHPKDFIRLREGLEYYIKNKYIFHLNIPIQSASDKILTLMNRGYTKTAIDDLFNHLKKLEFYSFDTHLIIGFPGETYSDFLETMDFIRKHKPTYILCSTYYDTPAAESYKLPNKVNVNTILERARIAKETFEEEDIVYNIDSGDFINNRFSRINKIGE